MYFPCADLFEVACLIGATFIVNYVTADSKTNWAEGMAMVIFYVMIVRLPCNRRAFLTLTGFHHCTGPLLLVLLWPT